MAQSYTKNIHNHHDVLIDLDKKIESLTKGASSYYNSLFKTLSLENRDNAKILYDFLESEYNIQNVKLSTIVTHIKAICLFNEYLSYKDFEKITKEDVIYYLSSLRKKESDDPTHKWIGTYNTRQMVLNKFFRWLYNHHQNSESDHEKWITAPYMQGIKQLSRKEKSSYKPSDIWTNEDHALFLKYCPVKRDKCYHAMANDTSCRPHELLSLKLKDIKFKVSSTGIQYAEVHIIESKTKPRTLPLIFSIPYVKALGGSNDNYNDNEKIQNEFDNSEDQENIDDQSKSSSKNNNNDNVSIADELRELAKLKEEGIITQKEFNQMKKDLIE